MIRSIGFTQQQEKGPIELTMCVENTLPANLHKEDKNLKCHTRDFPLKDRETEVRIDEDDDDSNR